MEDLCRQGLLMLCMPLLICLHDISISRMEVQRGCAVAMLYTVCLLKLGVYSGGQVCSSTSLRPSTRRSRHSRERTAMCRLSIPLPRCSRGRAGTLGKDSCAMA